VAVGRQTGILDTKKAAVKLVLKFPNGCYKDFHSKPAAQEWFDLFHLKRSNEKLLPDVSSFKSSADTQYSPVAEPGSSPQRPIDSILDITKVGHDPSVAVDSKLQHSYGR
jgi:viroplasmin and RNaseH domain-containing protein